ncbi:MAG: transglutaminase family protein, partial [Candidatus Promineifilaceae bacterium]
MTSKGKLYKVVAVLVSFSMLFQVFIVPATWLSSGVKAAEAAVAEAAGRETADLQPTEENSLDTLAGDIGPTALDEPISITKMQSAFVPADVVSNQMEVTFTVFNNQSPTLVPEIAPSATITDALDVFSAYDYFTDPNTIRDVVISDTLSGSSMLVSADPQADSQGDSHMINLGDILPGGSVTVTLTIEIPGSVADFTELDLGAAVFGQLQGKMVTAESAPITLAPNSFSQYLQWTPDADTYDQEMLRQKIGLGMDPTLFFELVRSFGYESYEGSLRGTLGTLWSEAGNSLDQASLLIAMLRSSGVPARYVRGTLNTSLAQQLVLSMFPDPTQLTAQVPPGEETADPADNPTLLAETQDHWWVQAYIGGAWTDLDPTFTQAQPGDVFTTVDETLNEVPDALRHKVTLSVKVEKKDSFDFFPDDFTVTYPLSATFNTVSVAGKPIMFGHLVNSTASGGVYVNYEHDYTPYFTIGKGDKNLIEGETYQDFLTNFPFGSSMVTGVWLTVTATEPDGDSQTYEREFVDLLGPDLRQPSGVVTGNLERPDANQALISTFDFMQIHVVPQSRTPESYVERIYAQHNAVSPLAAQATQEIDSIPPEDEAAYAAALADGLPDLLEAQRLGLDLVGTAYQMFTTSPERELDSAELLVKSYPTEPKLLLLTQRVVSDTFSTSFELLNVRERALAYPGQTESAAATANMIRTIGDKIVEYELLEQYFVEPPTSGLTALLEAANSDIGLALITQNTRSVLDALPISSEAKGRINAAVLDGKAVFVPREMVSVNGEMTIGWAEIDEDGNTRLATEDGRYAIDYGILVKGIGLETTIKIMALGAGVCVGIMAIGVILLAIATGTGG